MTPFVLVSLFGLAIGSFLNVCIHRMPRGESIIVPRSRCPKCQAPIAWRDNIPLLSYFLLRGRCRQCKARISPVYPLVEAVTAAALVLTFAEYGFSKEFVKYGLLCALVVVVIFTDLLERQVPHRITIAGIAAGIVLSVFVSVDDRPLGWLLGRWDLYLGRVPASLVGAAAGALFGGGLFYVVGEAFHILSGRKKEYLGFGDVMLMLMVGTFLGLPLTLETMLLGSLLGTVLAAGLTLLDRRFRDYQWPYGSFLGLAAIFAVLRGNSLLDAYLRTWGIR